MFKYIYKIGLVILSLTMFTACNDDNGPEDIFGEDANTRLEKEAAELRTLLKSSPEGWKMTYFTDDPRYTDNTQQLGGWNFIFKMTDDKNVTMISDYSAETLVPKTSEYQIILGSVTKLSFATKNHIHVLSDAVNFPISGLSGKGYKGDFEFLYYGQEGEDIILRSNRFQIEIRLTKATAQDWTDLDTVRQNLTPLNDVDITLEINQGGEISEYPISYNSAARFATNTVNSNLSFGVAPMLNGLQAIKPIPVGNQEAINFIYDANNNWYIAELDNGNTAKIVLDTPDPTAHLFEGDYYFSFQVASGTPSLNSTGAFVTAYNEASQNIITSTDVNVELFGFFIVPSGNNIQYIFYDESTPNDPFSLVVRNITYSIDTTNDRIIISGNGGWQNPNFEPLLQPLEDVIFNPDGLKIIDTGNSFNQGNVYGFRSYNDSDSVFYTWTIPL